MSVLEERSVKYFFSSSFSNVSIYLVSSFDSNIFGCWTVDKQLDSTMASRNLQV